jgi:hypothetical protein
VERTHSKFASQRRCTKRWGFVLVLFFALSSGAPAHAGHDNQRRNRWVAALASFSITAVAATAMITESGPFAQLFKDAPTASELKSHPNSSNTNDGMEKILANREQQRRQVVRQYKLAPATPWPEIMAHIRELDRQQLVKAGRLPANTTLHQLDMHNQQLFRQELAEQATEKQGAAKPAVKAPPAKRQQRLQRVLSIPVLWMAHGRGRPAPHR